MIVGPVRQNAPASSVDRCRADPEYVPPELARKREQAAVGRKVGLDCRVWKVGDHARRATRKIAYEQLATLDRLDFAAVRDPRPSRRDRRRVDGLVGIGLAGDSSQAAPVRADLVERRATATDVDEQQSFAVRKPVGTKRRPMDCVEALVSQNGQCVGAPQATLGDEGQ